MTFFISLVISIKYLRNFLFRFLDFGLFLNRISGQKWARHFPFWEVWSVTLIYLTTYPIFLEIRKLEKYLLEIGNFKFSYFKVSIIVLNLIFSS